MFTIENILLVAVGTLFVLVLSLMSWLWRVSHHYNKLTMGITDKTLMNSLENIQKTLASHEAKMSKTAKKIEEIIQDSKAHLQHLVVKRFNPFGNTGGDQSFIMGLLDGNKNGIVITSLHSRENTRFYVKLVSRGEGEPHPLSDEEQKVIKKG